ncbi:MAG: hypothetical protein L0Z49_06230 [Actinobacteria bacterium]|nr:hypothetical protein [Actinomycetota bacterium]MCI0544030.1 hypothetical protein [Actinomycetota bacterium]MCI0679627.1 hypothetical protein [Actinomycetota bacterium]
MVLSSLADDAAVRAVYLGPDGVTNGISSPTFAVDTSTERSGFKLPRI